MAEVDVATQTNIRNDDPASGPLAADCRALAARVKKASRAMALAGGAAKNAWLIASADALVARAEEIIEANARDVAAAPGLGRAASGKSRRFAVPRCRTGLR